MSRSEILSSPKRPELECALPAYLQRDLDAFKRGLKEGSAWLLKFPPSAAAKPNELSYSNSAYSEHLGSTIYRLLGVEAQETRLGTRHNGNWGFLADDASGKVSLAPVFDCGRALSHRASARLPDGLSQCAPPRTVRRSAMREEVKLCVRGGRQQVADEVARCVLTLPTHYELELDDVKLIALDDLEIVG